MAFSSKELIEDALALAGQPSQGRLESSSSVLYERYRSIPKRVEPVFLRGLNGAALRALWRVSKQEILPATYESLYGAIVNRFSCENGGAGKIPLAPPDLL